MTANARYVQMGQWFWCYHCRVIIRQGHYRDHYCGAPWQERPNDIPDDWTPNKGFTREDVRFLRFLAFEEGWDKLDPLADRIEALLPPEGE